MTTEELWSKIDNKFTVITSKLDEVATTTKLHDLTLAQTKKDIAEVKKDSETEDDKIKDRLSKVEKWMWLSIGAGGAAGAGLAKLFL